MLSAILLTIACTPLVQAAPDEAEIKRMLVPYYIQEASRLEFFLDVERQLKFVEQPVLIWTNADKYMGAVFIWTFQGRPEMIGCIGSHQNRPDKSNVFQEFHSLSLQALPTVNLRAGKPKEWTPSKPGLAMVVVNDAPRPATSERLRLTQMRNLAREFDGWMKDGEDVAQLRLLPQPIFRYQSPDRGVVDGAIFALVWKGTDPEILLVLEDRGDSSDERWHYALARFNYREMWVKRHDKELWRVPVEGMNDVYITRLAGEINLDDLKAAGEAEASENK